MTDFDRLNRQTREWNNNNFDRLGLHSSATPKYGTSAYWQNYWNNKTYKHNNGQYSDYYSYNRG